MDRRKLLQLGAVSLAGSLIPSVGHSAIQRPVHFGYLPRRKTRLAKLKDKYRSFNRIASKDVISSGKGKTVLLYKYLEKALGTLVHPAFQGTGDCVGQAYSMGVDHLAATQIYGSGRREKFLGRSSPEVIYAGSRYEIGYLVHGDYEVLRHEGSTGEWAAEFLKQYGTVPRGRYGKLDLTRYDSDISDKLGRVGIPDELEEIAKQYPVRTYALVRSYSDVRDSIANGYPVILCSGMGFNPDCSKCNPGGRDAMGFLQPCGTWWHAMLVIGVDDSNDRPGALILNSWGPDWVRGGTRLDQPLGSFWVDAVNIDKMCQYQLRFGDVMEDCYAISDLHGIVRNNLPDYHVL